MANFAQISEKLRSARLGDQPFNLLYLLFEKIDGMSIEESGRSRKERLHSDLLAGLLDPSGKGDGGSILIEELLEEAKLPRTSRSQFFVKAESYVGGESGSKRPIDILVTWIESSGEKHALIIENKLADAPDQPNQLNDYHYGLAQDFLVDGIIYLTLLEPKQPIDLRPKVRSKVKCFTARYHLLRWLDRSLEKIRAKRDAHTERNVSAIIQYQLLMKRLTTNELKTVLARDLLKELSLAEANKLEALLLSKEWGAAKFRKLTEALLQSLGNPLQEELKVNASLKEKKERSDSGPCHVARYDFENSGYWLEIFFDDQIILFLCSGKRMKDHSFAGRELTFDAKGNCGAARLGRKNYYYYFPPRHRFNYPEKPSEVNRALVDECVYLLRAIWNRSDS